MSDVGYVCKTCGNPSPIGIGHVDSSDGSAERSADIYACQCGNSIAPYITLTPALARIARETGADVSTPSGSLGVVAKAGRTHAVVDVGNSLADDFGSHRYPLTELSVYPGTVDYWRRQGYVD